MRQETTGFGDAVASEGQYAKNLHLAPDRLPHACGRLAHFLRPTFFFLFSHSLQFAPATLTFP